MRDQLALFNPIFSEVHYKLATAYGKFDGNCFIYNPEMVLKVQPITFLDRIDYLILKKRFDEAVVLMSI